jgi:hypothetical protein
LPLRQQALDRLAELASRHSEIANLGGRFGVLVEADREAQGAGARMENVQSYADLAVPEAEYLLSEIAASTGSHRVATGKLSALVSRGSNSTFVRQFLGRELLASGEGKRVSDAFNDAHTYSSAHWLESTHHQVQGQVTLISTTSGWTYYRYRDKWIARLTKQGAALVRIDGKLVLLGGTPLEVRTLLHCITPKILYLSLANLASLLCERRLLAAIIQSVRPHTPMFIRKTVGNLYRRRASRSKKARGSVRNNPAGWFRRIERAARIVVDWTGPTVLSYSFWANAFCELRQCQ